MRFHFLRDLVNDGTIQLDYCPTQEQLADFMMKVVKLDTFEKLRNRAGVVIKKD